MSASKIVVQGREYAIPTNWKLGELRIFQQVAGVGLAELSEQLKAGNAAVLTALVFLTMKRQNPQLTLDQVDELEIEAIRFDAPAVDAPAVVEETPPGDPQPAVDDDGASEPSQPGR